MADLSNLIAELEGHPEAIAYVLAKEAAADAFHADLDAIRALEGTERHWALVNARTRFALAWGVERAKVVKMIDRYIKRALKPAKLGLGYERALRTAIAYEKGIRLSSIPAHIPAMQAARKVASLHLELPDDFADWPIEEAARFWAYLKRNDMGASEETMRRTIRRFRKSLKGKKVVRFDRDKLEFEVLDAELAYFPSSPRRPGRPRKA